MPRSLRAHAHAGGAQPLQGCAEGVHRPGGVVLDASPASAAAVSMPRTWRSSAAAARRRTPARLSVEPWTLSDRWGHR